MSFNAAICRRNYIHKLNVHRFIQLIKDTPENKNDVLEKEKISLTPESGFNLVGIDPFEGPGKQLYLVEHFDRYQDALQSKKQRKNENEYYILYKGPGGELCCR